MRKLLIFIIFLGSLKAAQAQFKISGTVNNDDKNLGSISVSLKNDSKFYRLNQTDNAGRYQFEGLKAGIYTIRFSAIHVENQEIQIHLRSDTIVNCFLKMSANQLAEVQISVKKPLFEKKIDRTIFNVENSIAATGSDALELLAKVPGVRVLNDQVSLVGKVGVNVLINDRLVQLSNDDLSNYLKSISSNDIAKIEIITNPPAKYDAQGNNGLINIVLKKVTDEGFKGSVNAVFTKANHITASTGGNLSYRKDKVTFYTNFNIRKGSLVPFEQSTVFYPTQNWNIVNKDRNFRTVPSGLLGVDYQFSAKTLIGLSYNGGLTNFHSEENIKTTVYNKNMVVDSILNSEANARIKSHYHAGNIYLKQQLDSVGKQIVFNGDWFTYRDDKSRFFNNTSYFRNGQVIPGSFAEYLSGSKQNIDLYTFKADVDLPFKSFKLSAGTKFSFIRNQSDVLFSKREDAEYITDLAQSNLFNYTENTQALYLNLNKNFRKFEFQLGLRGEYTQIDGISVNEENQYDYFQLFPTLFINYKASDKSVFSASYGRRINRPAYRKLNPFRWYSNQFAYAEGNPFLKPSYNNNIEISHTYNSVFTSTLSFSGTNDGFSDINFIDAGSNIQVSKPVNFIRGYNYQFSNSLALNPIKWWQNMNQADVFYNVSKSTVPQTLSRLRGFGAYLSTTNQFVFNTSKTLLGELNFWYQFPSVEGLNNNKSQSNLDLGLRALFFSRKMQLALTASDVLKTNKYRFYTVVNNIRQEYNNYYDARQVRLTIRYNFGNEQIKQSERKGGNDEERKRSN